MTQTEKWWSTIAEAFGVPDFLQPWLDRFFETQDVELIQRLAPGPLLKSDVSDNHQGRAYKRGIIKYGEDGQVELADFHTRFEVWAIFEGWKDIPKKIQQRLTHWELEHYGTRNQEMVEDLKQGIPLAVGQKNLEYLLLHEAEELLERAEHIYLWPCNCRAMMKRCSHSLYTCLRFDNDRGLGWEISRERAKELTREANRQGLMQLGEVVVRTDGAVEGGLCNCCADCCFPHLLAERQSSQKIWPKSRYVAHYLTNSCISCGACVRRCPFQAFQWEQQETAQETSRKIVLKADSCRGCGVCATACPVDAIEMIALEN